MVEILVTLAIMAAMTAFAIPSFTKAVQRSQARTAINNLIVVHAAKKLYFESHWGDGGPGSLEELNEELNLKLVDDKADYHCQLRTLAGIKHCRCFAIEKKWSIYKIHIDIPIDVPGSHPIVAGTNPQCIGQVCP